MQECYLRNQDAIKFLHRFSLRPTGGFAVLSIHTLYLAAYLCIYNLRTEITIIFENNFLQLYSFFRLFFSHFSPPRCFVEKLCSTTACSAWIFNALFHGCFATIHASHVSCTGRNDFLLASHLLNFFPPVSPFNELAIWMFKLFAKIFSDMVSRNMAGSSGWR